MSSFFPFAFSQCCSFGLRCFLTLCVERTLDATRALLMLHSTDVVCSSHHESQAKRVGHRTDSIVMVAEQALQSEHLQVEIRGIRARVEVCTGGGACVGGGTPVFFGGFPRSAVHGYV